MIITEYKILNSYCGIKLVSYCTSFIGNEAFAVGEIINGEFISIYETVSLAEAEEVFRRTVGW